MAIDPLTVQTTPPPDFAESSAAELLRRHFAIEGSLKLQASERDQNFLVRQASGQAQVLKISNSAEDEAITAFQNAALQHLENCHPDISVPRIVRTTDGQTQLRTRGDDGRTYTLRVLTWLPGIPLRDADPMPQIATQLGSQLAALGKGLREFDHPASNYPLLWDIRQAGNLVSLLDHVVDEELRDSCRRRLENFIENLEPRLHDCRWQVIHNDLNWSNVLVDPEDTSHITGIIDFGDLVKSPLVIDIAVAAAYLCKQDDDPLSDVREFLRGYHTVSGILHNEFELLPELIVMRNVLTIVISNWRAARYPDNRDYLLRSEPIAKRMIETLEQYDASDIGAAFRKHCER